MSDLIEELRTPVAAPSEQPRTVPSTNSWRDPLGMLWKFLQRSWLLILLGVLSLLLILSALFIPQLPTHLTANPAEASRWIATRSDSLLFGNIIKTLGLFDILHSTLLRLLLTLIGLTLAIHFADILAASLHLYRLPKRLLDPAESAGNSVALASPTPLYSKHATVPEQIETEADSLRARLAERFDDITEGLFENDSGTETRILARHNTRAAFLRPLLMLGLLLSLVPVWNITVHGWELSPDPLGPGDSIRYELNELVLRYEVASDAEENVESVPQLAVQIGEEEQVFAIDKSLRTNMKQVEIRAATGPPALYISLPDGQKRLALNGQSTASSSVSLVFPGIGNEKFVLIPSLAMGLRIVRGEVVEDREVIGGAEEGQTYFLIEVFDQSDTEPIQSEELVEGQSRTIELAKGNTVIQIDSLPGLAVSARYLPATWLLFPALALVLIGALGYWRRPSFIFAQLFANDTDESTAIYQSNSLRAIEEIEEIEEIE